MKRQIFQDLNRKSEIKKILAAHGPINLEKIRAQCSYQSFPATGDKDKIHEWLISGDGIGHKSVNGIAHYFLSPDQNLTIHSSNNCTPTTPLKTSGRQTRKRSFMKYPTVVWNGGRWRTTTANERALKIFQRKQSARKTSKRPTPARQTPQRPIAFDGIRITSTAIKNLQKPREIPRNQGNPKLYSALMVGDDNFVNIGAFDFNYELSYRITKGARIRHCGDFCFSGLRIAQATQLIEEMDYEVEHVIFNVGSVDLAEGRELIQMFADIEKLLFTCEEYGIVPILTTLPPLPNYLLDDRKLNLQGFNDYLRYEVARRYAVIDLNFAMVNTDGSVKVDNYQSEVRKVGGSHKAFVMWNKRGRNQILRMLIQNLGQAILKRIPR